MTLELNTSDDNPQNMKHYVLIDGDFGRHELFSNIHLYTLNQIGRMEDASALKARTENAMKLINDLSNIHYHIYYNFSCIEVDEYYKELKLIYPNIVWLHSSTEITSDHFNNIDNIQKFIANKFEHEYDYIWIIHGIENDYNQLLQQLISSNNFKAMISKYSWLENLKDGSNRIEYLIK